MYKILVLCPYIIILKVCFKSDVSRENSVLYCRQKTVDKSLIVLNYNIFQQIN